MQTCLSRTPPLSRGKTHFAILPNEIERRNYTHEKSGDRRTEYVCLLCRVFDRMRASLASPLPTLQPHHPTPDLPFFERTAGSTEIDLFINVAWTQGPALAKRRMCAAWWSSPSSCVCARAFDLNQCLHSPKPTPIVAQPFPLPHWSHSRFLEFSRSSGPIRARGPVQVLLSCRAILAPTRGEGLEAQTLQASSSPGLRRRCGRSSSGRLVAVMLV